MKKNWHGLLKILEINYLDSNKKVIWSDKNLYNIFHQTGEQYMLTSAFSGGATSNAYIPTNFYFGLDNRSSLAIEDTMTTIVDTGNEPNSNGYSRVAISSTGIFDVSLQGDHYMAFGPIISFSATGVGWGPMTKLFLTTKSDNTGLLIASVPLTQPCSLIDGESVNMRMGLALSDC